MAELKRFYIVMGDCTGCGGCAELQPEYIGWEEGESRPLLLSDVAPEDVINELQAFCPEDCFECDS